MARKKKKAESPEVEDAEIDSVEDQEEAPAKVKKPTDKTFTLFLVSIVVGILCLVLAGGYFFTVQPGNFQKAQYQSFAKTHATLQARALQNAMTQFQGQLQMLANNRQLIQVMSLGDMRMAKKMETNLNFGFPPGSNVRVIPLGKLGIAGFDAAGIELNNSIEIDMMRKVSRRQAVPPEAFRLDGVWHIAFAQAIQVDETQPVLGALLFTIDVKNIQPVLEELAAEDGMIEMLLRFDDGEGQSVIAAGTGTEQFAAVDVGMDILNWFVKFTPNKGSVEKVSPDFMAIGLAGLVSLLLIILVFMMRRACCSQWALETDKYMEFTKALMKNPEAEIPTFMHKDFKEGAEHLIRQRRQIVAAAPAAKEQVDESSVEAVEAAALAAVGGALSEPLFDDLDIDDFDTGLGGDFLDLDDFDGDVSSAPIPAEIFRAYDIRGRVGEQLDESVARRIGMAIGSEAQARGQSRLVVADDGRLSGASLKGALAQGLCDAGCDVVDVGTVPTPLMYFACEHLHTLAGVMVTGSHNPKDYNGFKIVLEGQALAGDEILALKTRIDGSDFTSGTGEVSQIDVIDDYVDRIVGDLAIAQPLKIVLDAGNGVASVVAPKLFEELGCEVLPLYCDLDGNFPNHHPDPSRAENLSDLKNIVKSQGADLGIAFDGDADRMGIVSASGKVIEADYLMMLFAQDVVSRNPGSDVVFDVKCTRNLASLISSLGGRPVMSRSGHSFIKQKMREVGAQLGGEYSGHFFFKERWYGFDDGIYSAARLVEILSTTDADIDAQLESFPQAVSTPEIQVEVPEEEKFQIVAKLSAASFEGGKINDIDGVRVDFPNGWGLVRASNTTPKLTMRFEADSSEELTQIKSAFAAELNALGVDTGLL